MLITDFFKARISSWLEFDSILLLLVMHYFEAAKQTICLAHSVVGGRSSTSISTHHRRWTGLQTCPKKCQREASWEREDGGSSREDRAANNIHVQKVLSFISLGLLIMDLAGIERKISLMYKYTIWSLEHVIIIGIIMAMGPRRHFSNGIFPKYFFPNYGGGTKMDNTSFLRFFLKAVFFLLPKMRIFWGSPI